MKYAVAACNVRDEQRDIEEWARFHLSVGFEEIVIVDDHSEDGTADVIRSIDAPIRYIEWDKPSIQIDMYTSILRAYKDHCRWLAFIDADEFLYPSDGGDIRAVLADYEQHAAVGVYWRVYGSSGLEERDAGAGLAASFLHRASDDHPRNRSVKSIVQPSRTLRPITSHMFEVDGRTVDENKEALIGHGTFPESSAPAARLRVNHYHVKSRADFDAKRRRGTFGPKYARDDDYERGWRQHDCNDVFDPSALRYYGPRASVGTARSNAPVRVESSERTMRHDLLHKIWRGKDPFAEFPEGLYQVSIPEGKPCPWPFISEAIEETRPRVVVEVGVFKGGTSIAMAAQMKSLGIAGATVIAVDTWLGAWDHWLNDAWFPTLSLDHGQPMMMREFMANVKCCRLDDVILPLPLDSVNAAELLRRHGVSVDMIHIDGGHDYRAVTSDLEAWWPLLGRGAIVIGDDYVLTGQWPEVRRAFDDFAARNGLVLDHEPPQPKCRLRKP